MCGNVRQAVHDAHSDYIPVFLSEIHLLMKRGLVKHDVALIHASPSDHHGGCSPGASIDVALVAIETANLVIADVNQQARRTHGADNIHLSKIDLSANASRPIFECAFNP